jgi:hypothetical protein
MKELTCDSQDISEQLVKIDKPVKLISGRIEIGGNGKYRATYLTFRDIVVKIGPHKYHLPDKIIASHLRTVEGKTQSTFDLLGATHVRFSGSIRLVRVPLPPRRDGCGTIYVCRQTTVEFLRKGRTANGLPPQLHVTEQ